MVTTQNWLVAVWNLSMFDDIDDCYDDKSYDDDNDNYLASGY